MYNLIKENKPKRLNRVAWKSDDLSVTLLFAMLYLSISTIGLFMYHSPF